MITPHLTEAAYEALRIYGKIIGEVSKPSYREASDSVRIGLQSGMAFLMGNPESTPEDLHNNWLNEKLANGWKHGKVKDVEAKIHPCFMDFSELPKEEQKKDSIFLEVFLKLKDVDAVSVDESILKEIVADALSHKENKTVKKEVRKTEKKNKPKPNKK